MANLNENNKGQVFSINISAKKGVSKTGVKTANLIENFGIESDVHSGNTHRQISLLSWESIEKQNTCHKHKKKNPAFKPGDFAENITTCGINLANLKVGDKLTINNSVILEISQIGKECHDYCEIFKKVGSCIMPKEGIFAKVIKGGQISVNDPITPD
ncbi:MAG: MOSC domain-containing protein [Candidatus Omnitrophota bacterium]|nr:MOSC domain-containing protein [Candidatus Omnitrophota bacterium]